jgi:4-hydroxythreonine-4-phosphate dehydrogenase
MNRTSLPTMTKPDNIPRLALTLGEPAGIGPDLCLLVAQSKLPAEVVVVGSPDLLLARAKQLNISIKLDEWKENQPPIQNGQGRLAIIPVDLKAPCEAGTLDPRNAAYVLETLNKAHVLCASHICEVLVTGPVHKAIMKESGVNFLGHTEYLAELAGIKDVLMTFYTPDCIVAMMTTHVPLKEVHQHITAHRLTKVIEILHQGLVDIFHHASPVIHVCGVNPHAGEEGRLGDEEQKILIPTLQTLRERGFNLVGPLSGDTAFTPSHRQQADAIVAMYHDQGLAPIKALYFEEIVNVTMGLPYLRTSVDHGTALSLAGTGNVSIKSLQHAIHLAAKSVAHG